MQWKDFLYFSKRERKGILVLLFLIAIISLGIEIANKLIKKNQNTAYLPEEAQHKFQEYLSWQKGLKPKPTQIKSTFDPNICSFDQLIELGIPQQLAKNIVGYRKAGGIYHKKEDLLKLYTIDQTTYAMLADYVEIKSTKASSKVKTQAIKHKEPTRKFIITQKLPPGTQLSLNDCDTVELKKVPGIGSYTAQKICRYRQRLGGFYTTTQLHEIGLSQELDSWFTIDSTRIQKLKLNESSFQTLVRHPYLSYEQVKAVFNFKRKHGKIKSIKQLQLLEEFDAHTINQLTPYLSFN